MPSFLSFNLSDDEYQELLRKLAKQAEDSINQMMAEFLGISSPVAAQPDPEPPAITQSIPRPRVRRGEIDGSE